MTRSLTTKEVATLTDPPVSRHTVLREIRREKLAADKGGGRWLVEPAEAERWAKTFRSYQGLRKPEARD